MERKSLPLNMKPSLNASSKRMVPVTFWVQVFHFMVFKEQSAAHKILHRPVIYRVGEDVEGGLQCSKLLRGETVGICGFLSFHA